MKSGEKNVEYRTPGDFIFSRLYNNYSKTKFSAPKKLSHILFQAGYNPDSPRMLVELKGWNIKGINFPSNLITKEHDIDSGAVNLFLGTIIYENLDMSRENEFNKKEDREYSTPRKSAKAKKELATKLSNRRTRIHSGDNKRTM